MVRGLTLFRERFAGFTDRYVLIGGAAVEVAMDAAGIEFRLTKGLDIILHVESLDTELAQRVAHNPRAMRFQSTTTSRAGVAC